MVFLSRRKGFLPYRIVWFDEKPKLRFWPITVYYQSPANLQMRGLVQKPFWTFHHNLESDPTEWLSKMNSTTRNEIRQSEKLELVRSSCSSQKFIEFFNAFAQDKGIDGVSGQKVKSFGSHFEAVEIKIENRVLAMHAYLVDASIGRVRLLFSASDRFEGKEDRNLIGKANRFLHWCDLNDYRNRGFRIYDWGGFAKDTLDPEKLGINQFKAAFGGFEVCEYHYYPWYLSQLSEST